jgi:arylformamidase
MTIYDVSVPISESMPVWPGDPPVQIERVASIARGDELNLSHLSLGSHTGTHVDAPFHFIEQGLTVDRLPPEILVGPAFVASLQELTGTTIEAQDLADRAVPSGISRLLLKTRNSGFWRQRRAGFQADFVHLSSSAARWLVERRIQLVGIDYLSVEALHATEPAVHRILLGAGTVIVEGLDLSQVPPGPCQLVCLPLKIEGGDGAPARVLVIRD